ncbi:MAG: succinylglutamate desuccinylase/aspartoacylase family protein [Rhodobacterales bacterium]|nr:succinylglutamate desuccinylase/aspartoacylase family protein [Rhodobacterales bacterium]
MQDGLDRRDFMLASLITAGGAGVLAAAAGGAAAQEIAGGVTLTGDVIGGKPVITALDVAGLPAGKHRFYFRGVEGPSGHVWHVSIMVARGAAPGKRVLLTSGVHGDEISPVRTIQKVMEVLDPATMAGTVTAVFDISRPAIEGMARRWPNSNRGIDLLDINREFPGNEAGFSAASRHAGLLFNRVFQPNADLAIDYHTVSTGMDGVSFHLADMTNPVVAEMAMLFPIDQILDSTGGYPGILGNELTLVGIPTVTAEIGNPRVLDLEMIGLFVEGTLNVLKANGVIGGPLGRTGKDSGIIIGNTGVPVITTRGGYVELLVKLRERVTAGQKVAVQFDAFGDVVAEYASPVAGVVATRRTDATCEEGSIILFILMDQGVPGDPESLPE